jgi:hypothetical protein
MPFAAHSARGVVPVQLHDLLTHHQEALPKVDIAPSQSCRLTAPQARHGDQLEDRPERVGAGVVAR